MKSVNKLKRQSWIRRQTLLVVFGIVSIGLLLLAFTHAAGTSVFFEAEAGTIVSPAQKQSLTSASNGEILRFGSTESPGKVLSIPSRTNATFCRGVVGGQIYGDGQASAGRWVYNAGSSTLADEFVRCGNIIGISFTRSGNQITNITLPWAGGGDFVALATMQSAVQAQGWIIGMLYGEGNKGNNQVYDATEQFVPNSARHAADVIEAFGVLGATVTDTVTGSGSGETHVLRISAADLDVIQAAAGGGPDYVNAVDRSRIPGI